VTKTIEIGSNFF